MGLRESGAVTKCETFGGSLAGGSAVAALSHQRVGSNTATNDGGAQEETQLFSPSHEALFNETHSDLDAIGKEADDKGSKAA